MGTILCATRGGEASVLTQKAAVKRAKQEGHDLVFFYVFDLDFLALANYAQRSDVVEAEMTHMADFLLLMAQERAEQEGVTSDRVRKRGPFYAMLLEVIGERDVDMVILGRPDIDGPDTQQRRFELDHLTKLADRFTAETGVPVWIPPEELYFRLQQD